MKQLRLLLVVLTCVVALGPHALLAQEPITVDIDIKPGSDQNCINNDGHGVIPVAILGSADFDVHDVDAGTVELEGLAVAARGKSNKLLATYEDVNGDGYMDLVLKIEDSDSTLAEGSTTATLTGVLTDGTPIEGSDSISIVPPLPGPEAPTAADDAYSMDEDTTLTVDAPGVLGNDSDPNGDSLSAVLDGGPANGTLILNADGSFTYTPIADYNGTDSFTYMANDGTEDSNIATVTITVNPVSEPPTEMTVFVTSGLYDGDLGGLEGADAICQGLANAAGLEGTYKAWLSTDSVNAADRLTHSTVPYKRVDDVTIASDWADLTNGSLLAPIDVDENGDLIDDGPNDFVWTATGADGAYPGGGDCTDWTYNWSGDANQGYSHYVHSGWSDDNSCSCEGSYHLYCFQQPEPPETMTVFVTSQRYMGGLTAYRMDLEEGLAAADDICQTHADASSLVPEGTYKAWLSTATESAADRLTHATVPYVLVNGTVVADDWTDLIDGTLHAPINMDENGVTPSDPVPGPYVWTATGADGTFYSSIESRDCGGWENEGQDGWYGRFDQANSTWSDSNWEYCDVPAHLYCFQQPEPPDTKTVFLTSSSYPGVGLGGLEGADAKCQARATAAGLDGTYKAWLSTDGAGNSPATGRFTQSTVPYVLVDGPVIAEDWADLVDGSLLAPIDRDEAGNQLPDPYADWAWTATAADGTFYEYGYDCGDWADLASSGYFGLVGYAHAVNSGWSEYDTGGFYCDGPLHLYCFEQ